MGMLLQAEWRADMNCFVKQVREEPDPVIGFTWPVPRFEFYDRHGVQIEGRVAKQMHDRVSPPLIIDQKHDKWTFPVPGPFSPGLTSKTATEVAMRAEQSKSVLDAAIEEAVKQLDDNIMDHMRDALFYGMGAYQETAAIDYKGVSGMLRGDTVKIVRPPHSIFKTDVV